MVPACPSTCPDGLLTDRSFREADLELDLVLLAESKPRPLPTQRPITEKNGIFTKGLSDVASQMVVTPMISPL